MKIPAIKKLVETVDLDNLKKAESSLLEELPLEISVEGDDEGEKLTHVLAAIWIKEEMERAQSDFMSTLRMYTSRVRKSIS